MYILWVTDQFAYVVLMNHKHLDISLFLASSHLCVLYVNFQDMILTPYVVDIHIWYDITVLCICPYMYI